MIAHRQILNQRAGRKRHVRFSEPAVDDVLKVQRVDADNHVCDRVRSAAFEQIDHVVGCVLPEHHNLDARLLGEGFQRVGRQVKVTMSQDAYRCGSLPRLGTPGGHDGDRTHGSGKSPGMPSTSARPLREATCHVSVSPAQCRLGP